ncbi:hypothetical protein [Sporomusa sp. KB1]|jgi:hypothetical protein|uniref:hypothetical protein n=1 Tax=Sporomusa sp. KB1 TaxID=943346 RepID=UPI00119F9465|nr:hypothetical protein [Sporomusa sp. KB1]TWH52015.1 hypothetical protein Salpa_0521 [Sporomusa sp. KB1]
MWQRLSTEKKQEYEHLCYIIQKLSREIDQLEKEQKDINEINQRLEVALNNCFDFIRREFYDK